MDTPAELTEEPSEDHDWPLVLVDRIVGAGHGDLVNVPVAGNLSDADKMIAYAESIRRRICPFKQLVFNDLPF